MILCIESATSVCSVALSEGEKIISIREISEGFNHSEKITVFISELLKESDIKVSDLDAVAVSSGPGSYTGLRIGVSVAKGLCLSVNKPLIGISTLESMAFGARKEIKSTGNGILFCPMIDARRMEVYCALFDDEMNSLLEPSAIVISEELFLKEREGKTIYYFGDGAEKCKTILDNFSEFIYHPGLFPSAKFMAAIASEKFINRQFENLSLFEPFYLKEYQPGIKK